MGKERAATSDSIDLGVVHAWRYGAVAHVRLHGGDDAAAHADHHGVSGTEVFLSAIHYRAHAASHCGVLHGQAADARVTHATNICPLGISVNLEIVCQVLLHAKP